MKYLYLVNGQLVRAVGQGHFFSPETGFFHSKLEPVPVYKFEDTNDGSTAFLVDSIRHHQEYKYVLEDCNGELYIVDEIAMFYDFEAFV